MNSGNSTDVAGPQRSGLRDVGDGGFRPWHFYVPLSMVAATVAVATTTHTHPVALLLLSAAALAVGLVGVALHHALAGFFGGAGDEPGAIPAHRRDTLEREKMFILRSIKELEFDHKMGKISEADYQKIGGRLRARALGLMRDLESVQDAAKVAAPAAAARTPRASSQTPPAVAPAPRAATRETALRCGSCGTLNEADATFCKHCGGRLEHAS